LTPGGWSNLPEQVVLDRSNAGMDRERMGFGNRMRDRNELDAERADIDAAAGRHHGDRNFWRIAFGLAFGLEQGGREFCRIDRASELRPEIDDGAEMILVPVRQHQA